MRHYDVLTLGEALLRLTPPNLQLYQQTPLLERFVGGSELNTAVGLARFGLQVNWLSRLTDNAIGRLIEREARSNGVYTDDVIWTDADRIGIYYMEEGRTPRASQVIYDRTSSSVSRIQPSDLSDELLATIDARVLHLTGITLAISTSARATALRLLRWAQAKQIPVSFDVNYRSKLWNTQQAVEGCNSFMQAASIIFIPQRDALNLYGTDALETLQQKFPQATIVMTTGSDGSVAITSDGKLHRQAAFPAEVVCRIGGGDAFAAGYLYGYCTGRSIQQALELASASASLKYTLTGDLPLISLEQVTALISEGKSEVKR